MRIGQQMDPIECVRPKGSLKTMNNREILQHIIANRRANEDDDDEEEEDEGGEERLN